MERKTERENPGSFSFIEDSEIPRKRLRVEYLDEASNKDITIEDLSHQQTIEEETCSQGPFVTETPGKKLNIGRVLGTRSSSIGKGISNKALNKQTNVAERFATETPRKQRNIERFSSPVATVTKKQMRCTANVDKNMATHKRFNPLTLTNVDGGKGEDEVEQVLKSMKACLEGFSKVLKAKDKENKLLKGSKEKQHNPIESESEMLGDENTRLKKELMELKTEKENLKNENLNLQGQVDEKIAYIETILEQLVSQSKEMNGLHARIRILEKEKNERKTEEKVDKVWPRISVKPLSQLTDLISTNTETLEKSSDSGSSDNISGDILIPTEVVDNNEVTESIVSDIGTAVSDRDGDCQTRPDLGFLENPVDPDALGRSDEYIIKPKRDDLPDVIIDKVVAGRGEVGVKVENPFAAIDEGLDDEEMEIAELQRILDEEEKERERQSGKESEQDSTSPIGIEMPRDLERRKGFDLEIPLEKENDLAQETNLRKENDLTKECDSEAERQHEGSSCSTTSLDEGGREDNESKDDLSQFNEEEVLEGDEAFEDVDEDNDVEEEEELELLELEELDRDEVQKENDIFIASESLSAFEKNRNGKATNIPTDEEELESLNLLENDNDPGWLDCPLCQSPFLRVRFHSDPFCLWSFYFCILYSVG